MDFLERDGDHGSLERNDRRRGADPALTAVVTTDPAIKILGAPAIGGDFRRLPSLAADPKRSPPGEGGRGRADEGPVGTYVGEPMVSWASGLLHSKRWPDTIVMALLGHSL